jgi:hypothetical protein
VDATHAAGSAYSVQAAQRAFRNLLHAHTGLPDEDDCPEQHSCKYNAHMSWGFRVAARGEHDTLPIPSYVPAFAQLSCKWALARLRLSRTHIQTNLQLGVSYTQRLYTQGCLSTVDSERHLLLECLATEDVRAAFADVLPLADADLASLMDTVYQQDDIDNILEFAYRISKALPGR